MIRWTQVASSTGFTATASSIHIVFGIAKALSIIGLDPLTFRDVAVIMKLVSCFFYAASIIGLWVVLQCFKVDRTLAATFAFSLLAFPDYWTWATVVHPDGADVYADPAGMGGVAHRQLDVCSHCVSVPCWYIFRDKI